MTEFHRKYVQLLEAIYPSTKSLKSLSAEYTVSPYIVTLSKNILEQISLSIKALYSLSKQPSYVQKVVSAEFDFKHGHPKNDSVLMAYDFHVDPKKETAHLIEVNTNASGYLLCDLLYQMEESEWNGRSLLRESFHRECALSNITQPINCAIIDENINSQKMLVEFYMYKDLLNSWGWNTEITDIEDLVFDKKTKQLLNKNGNIVDFIYNRFCDFYLAEPRSVDLKNLYINQLACFSPHPVTYSLLADKARLVQWSTPEFWKEFHGDKDIHAIVQKVLLPTKKIGEYESPEALWQMRKSLFFKPRQAYGGKASYRGKNISRKMFERILNEDMVTQYFAPAPETEFPHSPGETSKWKYDIRCFVYQDQIQMVAARLYQGQLTNFSTINGGFARVKAG